MKQSILALTILAISSLAGASSDFGMDLNNYCSSPEVKKAIGPNGSCRIIVAPKNTYKQGVCRGKFDGYATCELNYLTLKSSRINLKCYTDPKAPMVDELLSAEGVTVNASAIMRRADGKDLVMADPADFTLINNDLIEVILSETTTNGAKKIDGSIIIKLESEEYPLTDVVCQ